MNTLEKEVCRNLLEYNNENVIPDYPRLNQDSVKSVSKSITRIIYDSIQNENPNTKQNQDAIIDLISKWSKPIKYNHITINETNRSEFIKSLNSIKKDDDIFNEFQKKLYEENSLTNIWDEMIKTFNKQIKNDIENKTRIDLIGALDNLHLKKSGFDCNIPTIINHRNNIENSITFLKELSKNESKNYTPEFNTLKSILFQKDSNPSVGLGYALLNMERNVDNNLLLKKIINEIVTKNEMNEIEMNFIQYIWDHQDKLNIDKNIYDTILKTCPFLYEIPVLKLATSVLNSEDDLECSTINLLDDHDNTILNSHIKIFMDKTKKNDKLYYNILSCFYELFIISNYDRRLLKLFNNFKEFVENKKIS